MPLSLVDAKTDPYRQFPFYLAGCLFLNRYSGYDVILPEDILCPFARTPFKEPGSSQYGDKVHALPLSRVGYIPRNVGNGTEYFSLL